MYLCNECVVSKGECLSRGGECFIVDIIFLRDEFMMLEVGLTK